MKTPTMRGRSSRSPAPATPAAPATSATMNDQRSGCQMKPVLRPRPGDHLGGRSTPVRPARPAPAAATTAIAKAKPSTSSRRLRPTSPQRREHDPGRRPRRRRELRADHHRADDQDRGVGDHRDRGQERRRAPGRGGTRPSAGAPSSACAIDRLPDDRVVGVAGRGASSRRAAANGVPVGVVDHDAARLGEPEPVELVEDLARPSRGRRRTRPGHPRAGATAPRLDGHVGDAVLAPRSRSRTGVG